MRGDQCYNNKHNDWGGAQMMVENAASYCKQRPEHSEGGCHAGIWGHVPGRQSMTAKAGAGAGPCWRGSSLPEGGVPSGKASASGQAQTESPQGAGPCRTRDSTS